MHATDSVRRGHLFVVVVISILLGISLCAGAFTVIISGEFPDGRDVTRFVLSVGLCVMLYQGRGWARWLTIISITLGALAALVAGFALLNLGMPGGGIALLIMAAFYVIAGGLLISPEVKDYAVAKRQYRHA